MHPAVRSAKKPASFGQAKLPVKYRASKPQACFLRILLLAVLFGQGCAASYTWIRDQGKGNSRHYQVPFEVVWEAIPIVVRELGPLIVEENKKKGYFLAEGEQTAFSYGERITIYVKKIDPANTQVEVVSKRQWTSDLTARNWEKPILDNLDKTLNQRRG
ncbi:MAG: hypothetical protein HZA02_06855 [Nitrospinae bacterium]|nr:hypothetical protein [Nitrospinota bacterium]